MRPEVHTTPTNHANRLLRPGRLARSRLRLSVRRFAAAARADGHYDPPGCDLGRLLHHRRSLGASGPWSFEGGERQPMATAAARDARQNVLGVGQGVHGTHGGGWAGCHSGRRGCRAVGAAGNSLPPPAAFVPVHVSGGRIGCPIVGALFLAPRTDLPPAGRRGRGRRSLHAPRPPPAPRGHPAADLCGPRRPARGGTLVGCRSAPVVAVLKPAAYWVHRGLLGCNRGH